MKTTTLYIDNIENANYEIIKNNSLNLVIFPQQGSISEKTINIDLKEENAKLNILAIIIGTNKNQFPITINAICNAKNCEIQITARSVLFNNAKIDLKGKIKIAKNATKSKVNLTHHTLTLSKQAHCKTLPSLEIECNDVRASHSASIGKIDPNELFYLESRGINKKNAKIILIKNFIDHETQNIKNISIKKKLNNQIEKLLPCRNAECPCKKTTCPC